MSFCLSKAFITDGCIRVDIFRLTGTTSKYFQLPWCSKNNTNCSTISFKIALRPLNQLKEYGNGSLTVATILFECLHIKDIEENFKVYYDFENERLFFALVKMFFKNADRASIALKNSCILIGLRTKKAQEFFPIFSIDVSSPTVNNFMPYVKTIFRFYPVINVKSDSQIYCIRIHVHKKNIFSYPCSLVKSAEDYIYCRCDGNGLFSFMISGHSDSYFLLNEYLHPRLYLITAGIILFFVVLQNILRVTRRLKKNIFLLT
ncbi:hypothetical protein TNIN_323301 [Trichonephila inaurata madagascariensis]|uniref:Uncharacterized protein n=1 Tax=Trichonephila inaurata madagascariensis TaxID=2747483 RepID=A0A8X6XYB7_9ARAC|nr:hypothetical protein TNIN_323301 [Trichonephila inaurata madagascariensis]